MKRTGFCLFAACMLTLGCTMIERASILPDSGKEHKIRQSWGRHSLSNELLIGLRWVEKSEYADEKGVKKRGLTAGLDLWLEPPPRETIRRKADIEVHAGQRIEWQRFSIYVTDLSDSPKSIQLRVGQLKPMTTSYDVAAPETPSLSSGGKERIEQERIERLSEVRERRIERGKIAHRIFYDLSIELADVKMSEYADENGAKVRGLVAKLTVINPCVVPNPNDKYLDVEVHAGQRVEWEGYSIYVEELSVRPGRPRTGSVRFRVKPINPPGTGSNVPIPETPPKDTVP